MTKALPPTAHYQKAIFLFFVKKNDKSRLSKEKVHSERIIAGGRGGTTLPEGEGENIAVRRAL